MRYCFPIVLLFFLSNLVKGQKTEFEVSFSVLGSSFVENKEVTGFYEVGPKLSKGTAVNIASDFLINKTDSSRVLFLIGALGWYSNVTSAVSGATFRDNGSIMRSSTEGVIGTKQFAVAGKIGLEIRNKKNTIYSQFIMSPQYYFKSKNEGRLFTNWSVNYYEIDSLAMGGFVEKIGDTFDFKGYLLNFEIKLGLRLPVEDKGRFGVFVYSRIRRKKWDNFVKREVFGGGISYSF